MRRPLLAACSLALSAALAAAQVRSIPGSAACEIAPLARLGAVLGTLPGFSSPTLTEIPSLSAAVLPAVHDLSKAAVFIERAQPILAKQSEAAPQAQAEPVSAIKTLEAVNAALRDFTPEDLRSMPEEKLSRLASMVMDQASGKQEAADIEAVSALAEAGLRKVQSLKGKPLKERSYNPVHNDMREELVDVAGVPERVKAVEHDGMVLRHYTTKEGLDGILKSGGVWNGFLPYVELIRWVSKKTFMDLTGVFFTRPQVDGGQVGVPASSFDHYVDVKVSAKLPLLEIEPGQIFLIPMPGRTRSWIADLYHKWILGEDVSPCQDTVQKLDSRGGPGPDMAVPVEIVDYGKVGEKGRLAQLLDAAKKSTKKAVAKILKRKADGVKVSKVLASKDTKTIMEFDGVPSRVERLETKGKVYRHWIKDQETLKAIVRTGVIKAGPASYVEFTGSQHAYIKDIYPELRGVFFTIPQRSAAEPRVMNWEVPYYIDFSIPDGVEALRLDGDDVLLVPAEPGTEIPVKIVGSSRVFH